MISKHCGQQLRRETSDINAYLRKEITWKCPVCKKRYRQKLRAAKGEETYGQRVLKAVVWYANNQS